MKSYRGEFEELVLLTVAALGEDAYGVSIKESIESRCGRAIGIGALHSTMTRLEEKKYLKSWLGGATNAHGGRSKRYFKVTNEGQQAVTSVKALRDELWSASRINLSLSK
jgi:PadR family transcriptional regulator PadR